MKLYTTPNYFPPNTGDLSILEGLLVGIDPGQWTIATSANFPYEGSVMIDMQPSTKFMGGKRVYKVGDCVSVIVDYHGSAIHDTLVVWPQ